MYINVVYHQTNGTIVHVSLWNSSTETEYLNIETERLIGNGGDFGSASSTGFIVIPANTRIVVRAKADKTGNLTFNHGNFNIEKIK